MTATSSPASSGPGTGGAGPRPDAGTPPALATIRALRRARVVAVGAVGAAAIPMVLAIVLIVFMANPGDSVRDFPQPETGLGPDGARP